MVFENGTIFILHLPSDVLNNIYEWVNCKPSITSQFLSEGDEAVAVVPPPGKSHDEADQAR